MSAALTPIGLFAGLFCLPILLCAGGCGGSENYRQEAATETTPGGRVWENDIATLNNGVPTASAPSPGASPTYGTQTGTGFSTGDALHSSGQGSGMMGYHGVGAMGTSNAISDAHDAGAPDKSAKDPVLPPQ